MKLWLILAIGVTACRASEPPPEPEAAIVAPTPAKQPAPPPIPEDVGPAATISGYDSAGAVTCPPLAQDRRCIAMQDVVTNSCVQAGGEVRRCDDCRPICTHSLKH